MPLKLWYGNNGEANTRSANNELAHLGIVLICDKWEYNIDNDLAKLNVKVTHSSWP